MSSHSNGVLARKRNPFHDDRDSTCGDVAFALRRHLTKALAFLRANGPRIAANLAVRAAWHVRRNLTRRRMLSFPHLLILVWVFVLLRGESWIFHWKVDSCRWEHWEDWVSISVPTASPSSPALPLTALVTAACRREAPPPRLRRRSPAHRPPLLPRPALAPLRPHHSRHRQLPPPGLLRAPSPAPAGLPLLPRRSLRRRKGVGDGKRGL